MDCNETRALLEADVDGELDLVPHLELQRHLGQCEECRRIAVALRERKAALRQALPRFTAPPALASAVRAALAQEAGGASARESSVARVEPFAASSAAPAGGRARRPRGGWSWAWQLGTLAAAVVVALVSGYHWGSGRARTDRLYDEAVADHERSLQASHLMDVASTDQHTVKPWFAGKLEFSPPVTDLAAAGFPLIGGRLEQFEHQPAAALVFRRRQHAINLFIWPAGGHAVRAGAGTRAGFQVLSWSRGDLSFVAVSEIPAAELARFAAAFQAAVGSPENR